MTISLPGSSKKGFSSLFGRKKTATTTKPVSKKQLSPRQVAGLFDTNVKAAKRAKPAKLNESEMEDQAQLSSLRGALYSKD